MAYADDLRQTTGVDFEDVADLIDAIAGNWTTFTPSPSSSAGTGTYSALVSRYAKHNKTVHCSIYWQWSQATSAHAQVSFTLPVTAKNNSYGQFVGGIYTEAATGTTHSLGFIVIGSNATTATIRRDPSSTTTWPTAAGTTNYVVANFSYEAE